MSQTASATDEVTTLTRRSMAFRHSSVQINSVLAFKRAVTGRAIFAKFRMKGHWYPKMPSRDESSFRLCGFRGQSRIADTFPGSRVMPFCVSRRLRKLTSGTAKMHFVSFRNRLLLRRMVKKVTVISWCKLSSQVQWWWDNHLCSFWIGGYTWCTGGQRCGSWIAAWQQGSS